MILAPERTDRDILESATITALLRYLLSDEKGLAQNPDYLGKFFISGKWKQYLDNPDLSKKQLEAKYPGCIYYHLIRTKKFDSSLLHWIEQEKNSQVIILGTGFDTRAIRFEKVIKENNMVIYEVDLKAMLEYKQQIIEREIKCNTDHVKFVSCNFQKDNVIEKLLQHEFDLNKPTLILWEGVIYYLSQKNIEDYLELFKNNIRNKLQITFDYAFRDFIEGNLSFYGAKELLDVLTELGEPYIFGLNYNELEEFFDKRGFITKTNNTSFMLEALYLKDTYGNSVGKPMAFQGMADIIKK